MLLFDCFGLFECNVNERATDNEPTHFHSVSTIKARGTVAKYVAFLLTACIGCAWLLRGRGWSYLSFGGSNS